jgi:hypothetical protein
MALPIPRPPSSRALSIMTSDDEEIRSGRAWARKIDDPWDPLILTLDGGGIRGYSSLLIIQSLMAEVAKWENKLEEEEWNASLERRRMSSATNSPRLYNEKATSPLRNAVRAVEEPEEFSLDQSIISDIQIHIQSETPSPLATRNNSLAPQTATPSTTPAPAELLEHVPETPKQTNVSQSTQQQLHTSPSRENGSSEASSINQTTRTEVEGTTKRVQDPFDSSKSNISGQQQSNASTPRRAGSPVISLAESAGIRPSRVVPRVSSDPATSSPTRASTPRRGQISRSETSAEPQPRKFHENDLLPCHYFDFMYGTSTGGLIATMLGRLRMSVPQCLAIYRKVGNDLFGKRRSKIPLATKYDHRPLETAVREIVKTYCKQHAPGECNGEDFHPWAQYLEDTEAELDPEARICQSICLTATHNGKIDEAHLLRTYPHRYQEGTPNWITLYNQGADPLRIWQVTRATSAAPFYFKMLEADIRGELKGFKDGGIRENNPAGAAWSEFISQHGEDAEPALLLSIGTGRPNETHDGFASAWPGPLGGLKLTKKAAEKIAVFKNLMVKYTEGEEKHQAMVYQARGEHKWYKRLNVSEGLSGMKLDNWERGVWKNPETGVESEVNGGKSLRRMEEATWEYLERNLDRRFDTYAPPKVMLEQTAEKLVRHRRAREKTKDENPKMWDTFMGRWLTGELKDIDRAIQPDLHKRATDSSAECC